MRHEFAELKKLDRGVILAICVAALGYFADIYDLLLFGIVRVKSLQSLGLSGDELTQQGMRLLNLQMAGLLTGGILWGILGDKRGRLSVLFGSIFLYSIANLANAFVTTVDQYAILRFIAGVGLAGELGAGITLVAEVLPKHLRGYGTSFVSAFGILGAVVAGPVGELFSWRVSFIIGGVLGLLILVLRIGVRESQIFHKVSQTGVSRGNFLSLFTSWRNLAKYLAVIAIGIPLWYVVGILIILSPEFGRAFGMKELPSAGTAIAFNYLALTFGDFASGFMSQWSQSRKKVIFLYILATVVFAGLHLFIHRWVDESLALYYTFCFLMGLSCGYWALFVTVAAEQFGTNIRATVTTTAPNFVRASVIPLTFLLNYFKPEFGFVGAAAMAGVVAFGLSFLGLWWIEESFHKDLDYVN